MRHHRHRLVVALTLAGLVLGSGSSPSRAQEPELAEVPTPALERLEPAVREQLQAARSALEETLADLDAPAGERAVAYGELGRLYQLYERWVPAEAALGNARTLAPDDFRWTYSLAVALQDQGRLDEALPLLERAAELDPGYLAVPVRLGDLFTALGDPDAAERWYRRALELRPDAATAHYGLGRIALRRGDARAAIASFEAALSQQPEATAIHHPLALAWRKSGDLDKAKEVLADAGTLPPRVSDPLIRRLSGLSEGATISLILGNRARRQGLLDLALSRYERATELDPSLASAQYNAGALLVRMGRVDEARDRFVAALEADPNHLDARVNLALVERSRGHLQEARRHLEAVVASDPGDPTARLELVRTLLAVTSEERDDARGEAERHLQELAELPGGAALAAIGRAERARGQGDEAAEVEALRRAVELDRRQADAWFRLGELALRSGRTEEAITAFREAGEASPERLRAWLGLAEAAMRSTPVDADAALDALDEAVRLRPDDLATTEALARLLATHPDPSRRDGNRALELIEPWLQRAPGPRRVETLAMTLAAAGRWTDAVGWQERLLTEARRAGVDAELMQRLETNLARYREEKVAELSG